MKKLLLLTFVMLTGIFLQLQAQTCTGPLSVTISGSGTGLPLGIGISSQTNVLCFGQSTGAVTVAATGGTTPYQYKIGSGALQSSGTFTGLAFGTYIITAVDGNACEITQTVSITQPGASVGVTASVTSNYNGSQISCFGATDGTIVAVGSGGVTAYEYNINGGTYQSSATFSGLGAGTYTIGIKDANGCTSTTTATITAPSAITTTASVTSNYNGSQISCNGATDGAITVVVPTTGTAGGYTYNIDGGTYQTSNVFTGLGAGTYQLTAKDINGCTTANIPVTITAPSAITTTASVTSNYNGSQISCNGATDGAITVVVPTTGTAGGYTYNINGGTYQTSNVFTGLGAGTYQLTAKDINGCTTANIPVTITAPSAITTTASVTSNYNGSQISCNGATDGAITVVVPTTGTAGGYTYNINGGTYQTSNVFTGLGAGTYTLTAKDINGCTTAGISVVITAPSAITTTASVTSNYSGSQISCNGATDGIITVVVPTTGTAGGYTYNIDGGTYQTSNVFTGLGAGTYQLTAKDINGCTTANIPVTITAPAAITTTASVTSNYSGSQISCNGATDGIITVVPPTTGTAGGYTYNINGGTYQTSNVFTGLAAGTYTLTAKDINGCTTTGISVTITAPSAITTTASVTSNFNGSQLSCNGATDGIITVVPPTTGTAGGYTYNINGGTYQTSNVFTGLAAGTYTLTAKDINGCTTAGISVTITAPSAITTTASVTSNYSGSQISCNGATDGIITVVPPTTGTAGGYTYNINGGTYQTSNVFTGLAAGTYTLTAKDINGCTTAPISVTITAPSAITTTASVTSNYSGSQISCNGATDGEITVVIPTTGTAGGYTYNINGGTFGASNVFTGLAAGTYTLLAKDINGCTTAPISVTITAPSAITTTASVTSNFNGSHISCPSSTDGEITVVIPTTGTAGGYTYNINGGTFGASNVFTGLGAGTYTLIAKDINGCMTSPISVTIVPPAGVSITSATVTSNGGALFNGFGVSCATGQGTSNNGQITIVAAGGSGALQYSINAGSSYQGTGIFNTLTANTYSIMVKDGNNCTATSSVTVTAPTPIVAGTCTNANDACQLNQGEIKVTASGGVFPYTVTGSGVTVAPSPVVGTPVTVPGSPGTITTSGGNVIFTGLQGNVNYSFTVQDTNGCQVP